TPAGKLKSKSCSGPRLSIPRQQDPKGESTATCFSALGYSTPAGKLKSKSCSGPRLSIPRQQDPKGESTATC
ncbi:hypothetical protein, partial [Shigella sp. FC2175]|uniref:hypothetical protein n=1 Tax=Shigella sp. FC2175 TaxID=1898680 RepID=UPI001C0A67E8